MFCWPVTAARRRCIDGVVVSAEIIAQTRGEKVIIFKKASPSQLSPQEWPSPVADLLKITAIGAAAKKAAPKKAEAEAAPVEAAAVEAAPAPAKKPAAKKAAAPKKEA